MSFPATPPTKYRINDKNMRMYWYWMSERHLIFLRRYIDKEPPPWSDDWVFNEFKFTNVYRELDRGTLYYIEHILNAPLEPEQYLFETLVYRHFNHYPTWDNIEKLMREPVIDFRNVERTLMSLGQVYTNAHNVTGFRWGGSPVKVTNSITLLEEWDYMKMKYMDNLFGKYKDDMAGAWSYLYNDVVGVGGFTAYELVSDFAYSPLTLYDSDTWANAGPGARRGLAHIFSDSSNDVHNNYLRMVWLRDRQDYFFERYDLEPVVWNGKKLTLREIEHSLCEFSKYHKAHHGYGRPRNRFRVTEGRDLVYTAK